MDVHIPTDDGYWVSEKYSRLQEIIHDFSISHHCDLELRWIPPNQRTTREEISKPYCIFDNRTQTPVFFASELDTPEDILAKLLDIDNTNGDVLKRLDAQNAAVRLMQYKEQMEKMEEANELAAHMIASPKNWYRYKTPDGTVVKLDDERRRV